jgi:hypothetical protein
MSPERTLKTETPYSHWRSPSFVFLAVITLALFAYSFFDFFSTTYNYMKYPYEIDYGEGCSMLFLSQLQTQGTYFFDINNYPFSYATYPPVFILLGWVINLFIPSMLMAMRLLSVIATCLLMVVLYLLIYNRTRQRLLSIIFTLSFLSIWFVKLWAPLARVDMLVFCFTTTGLLIFQVWIRDNRRYWAFLFFVLAFFTKQNAVLAPLSILLFSLAHKDQRKYFLSYLASYAIPILALFFLLDVYTHGEAFKHLILYTAQRSFNLLIFFQGLLILLSTLAILLPLASPFRFVKKIWASDDLIYWLYLVLNLLSIPSVAVTGANINNFIEPALSTIILGAILSNYWIKNDSGKLHIRRPFLFFMALASLILLFSVDIFVRKLTSSPSTDDLYFIEGVYRNNRNEKKLLEAALKKTPGDVLCEDLTLLIQNRKPVLLGCSYPLAEQGLWNPEALVESCHKKRFSGIFLLKRIHAMPELAACIEKNYLLKKNIGPYRLYKPNETL